MLLVVVFDGLAEAEARVDADAFAVDAGGDQCVDALAQEVDHFPHHVGVHGLGLHVLGRALHVHHAQAAVAVDDGLDCAGSAETVDVVDHVGAGDDRLAHHLGLASVDRQRLADLLQRVQRRHHTRQLVFDGHAGGTGPGRFAADVDQVDAAGDHLFRPRHGELERLITPAVGK